MKTIIASRDSQPFIWDLLFKYGMSCFYLCYFAEIKIICVPLFKYSAIMYIIKDFIICYVVGDCGERRYWFFYLLLAFNGKVFHRVLVKKSCMDITSKMLPSLWEGVFTKLNTLWKTWLSEDASHFVQYGLNTAYLVKMQQYL